MHLTDLPTPAAVVDHDVLSNNCSVMAARLDAQGLRLRPHVKTHKCVEVARLQGGHGLTVSTLAEARAFHAAGFDDQILAMPLAPARIPEALVLAEQLTLGLLVDDPGVARALAAAAAARGQRVPVWLKIDCGYHRAGVDPESPEALALARQLQDASHLDFAGILTHAGHSYECTDRAGIRAVAAQEVRVSAACAARLRAADVPVPQVSIGSTPTLSVTVDRSGTTEGRPGNYAFHDLHQAGIGSCTAADVALSVLATVIGVYASRRTLVLDAGALALSKDPGPSHLGGEGTFGRLSRLDGRLLPGLGLTGLSQEHGKVQVSPEGSGHGLRVGDRVRILPNHSCLVAALHPTLHVVSGDRVLDRWQPVRGW